MTLLNKFVGKNTCEDWQLMAHSIKRNRILKNVGDKMLCSCNKVL